MTLDDLPFGEPLTPATGNGTGPRKCRRHQWGLGWDKPNHPDQREITVCVRCHAVRNEARARVGRNNRTRGGRHELDAARRYGGRKVGPLGGPWDLEGAEWVTQVKTHRGAPPRWLTVAPVTYAGRYVVVRADPGPPYPAKAPGRWDGIFALMEGASRSPRLLERYLMPGVPARDWIVVRGRDWPGGPSAAPYVATPGELWLDLWGRDE